jgi:hypothetical protein
MKRERKRGRPPIDPADPVSVSLHVRVPAKQYDALCQQLRRTRETVSTLLRRGLAAELRVQK